MKKAVVNSFIKQFVAVLKGDDAKAKAEGNFRKAHGGITAQIASKKADTVDLEDAVTNAKEKQRLALLNNGNDIVERNDYVRNLFRAKNELNTAEDALAQHLEDIEFLQECLAAIEAPDTLDVEDAA